MNNKTLIGVIVAILVIVGVVILMKGNTQTQQMTATPRVEPTNTASTNSTVSPTEGKIGNEVTVNVTTNGFEPSTVTVKAGTRVTWVNKSGQAVTVNSNPHPTHTAYPRLNLGQFADGKSVSLVFDKPGKYGYHNHLDPSQTGTVVVE